MSKIFTKAVRSSIVFVVISSGLMSYAEVTFESDIVYGHKDGMALVYDVLKPEDPNGAAIVFMMSGGWYSSWAPPENRARQFSGMLDAGFTMIPVYHGSAPRYHIPDAYSDVSRAIRHIKMNAEDYGVDPERIGVTGGSAGGHLALMVGLDSDEGLSDVAEQVMLVGNSVAAVVAYFPPVEFREVESAAVGIVNDVPQAELLGRFPALDFDEELIPSIAPILYVDAGDPPTLLIHGDADPLVDVTHSYAIKEKFDDHGVESDLIVIPGAEHGFRGEDAALAASARLAWFQKYLLD